MKIFRKILSRSPYSRTVSLTLGQKLKFVLNFSPIAIAAAECLEAIASPPRTGSLPPEGIEPLLHRGPRERAPLATPHHHNGAIALAKFSPDALQLFSVADIVALENL
jgi:hypothetical protein